MSPMTSRERVLAALNHEEPDRVPLDIGGGLSTCVVVEGYERLKAVLGIEAETRLLSKAFRVALLDEQVMVRLGSDCRPLVARPAANWTAPASDPGTYVDEWGNTRRWVAYGDGDHYWEVVGSPLADATLADLDRYPWPDPLDPGRTEGLAEEARALHEETPYAIIGDSFFRTHWELAVSLRGYEQLLLDVADNPDFVAALLSKLLKINLQATGAFLDAVGPYVDVIRTVDDVASQQGPLMSPAAFRRLIKPCLGELIRLVKTRSDAKVFYHSCGNITPFIDDLIEVGVDVLNPIQVAAMGDTAVLKSRFGERIAFWGGIDTQYVLPRGSVDEVRDEVRRRIRDLGPGGGFVLGPVHNIQPDVPPENIIAMAEATRIHGGYSLAEPVKSIETPGR
jgi:uroporphyrinogen decarboxylase